MGNWVRMLFAWLTKPVSAPPDVAAASTSERSTSRFIIAPQVFTSGAHHRHRSQLRVLKDIA